MRRAFDDLNRAWRREARDELADRARRRVLILGSRDRGAGNRHRWHNGFGVRANQDFTAADVVVDRLRLE